MGPDTTPILSVAVGESYVTVVGPFPKTAIFTVDVTVGGVVS